MSADLDPRDDLTDRLAAFGRQPVDPALQSQHLTAMAGVRSGSAFRTSLLGRAKVAAGVLAGFLIGATGLTTAGAMGPLQPISADVIEAVTPLKELPESASAKAKEAREQRAAAKDVDGLGSIGTERDWSDDCAPVEEGGSTYAGNRGRYLKQERAKGADAFEAAKASTCGKPIGGDDEDDATADLDAPKTEDTEGDEPKGKETAPGLDDDAERGQSAERKPASAGKSDEAPATGKPGSTPAASLPDQADDDATTKAPSTTPGEAPADPNAGPESDTEDTSEL